MKPKKKHFAPSVHLVVDRLKESTPELGDLNDWHIKAIHFFLRHILMVGHYRIAVDLNKKPKQIRVFVMTPDGKPLRFRLKKPELLDNLYRVLQVPDYVVVFPYDDDKMPEEVNDGNPTPSGQ
jgi:hypothetical protein